MQNINSLHRSASFSKNASSFQKDICLIPDLCLAKYFSKFLSALLFGWQLFSFCIKRNKLFFYKSHSLTIQNER